MILTEKAIPNKNPPCTCNTPARRLSPCPALSHPAKRRRSHEQRFGAPARRAAFGEAECGRRRLSPPPHSCCPQSGQHGVARFSVIYRLRRLAFPQICTGSVLWRFAAHSCTSGIEKATAHAEEGARRLTRQAPSRGVRLQSPARRLSPCPALSHPAKRRRSHEQRFGAPARRAAFGEAECGRRRLSPPPHSCCPQSGQHGAAQFSVIYRLRRLTSSQICTGSILWRFATHSCTSGIEKATTHAEEGARRLTRQAPSRGVRPATIPHGGFLHALPSLTPQNAAAHTSSALAHLRGAPHLASPMRQAAAFAAASFALPAKRAARRRAVLRDIPTAPINVPANLHRFGLVAFCRTFMYKRH